MKYDKPGSSASEIREMLLAKNKRITKLRAKAGAELFGIPSGIAAAALLAGMSYYSILPIWLPLWLVMMLGFALCVTGYYLYGLFRSPLSHSQFEEQCERVLASERSMQVRRRWDCMPRDGERLHFTLIENVNDPAIQNQKGPLWRTRARSCRPI